MEREFMDYKKMGIDLNQFMGSSSSIGAKRVTNVCVAFRVATQQNNRAGWVLFFYSLRPILNDLFLT
jgi:histidine-containing phosphotransfer protein